MISLALGLIVIGGVLYVTAGTMRTNTNQLRTTHLNQELRGIVQMITRDLRRVGYRKNLELAAIYASRNTLTLSALTGNMNITSAVAFGDWATGARIMQTVSGVSYCADISAGANTTTLTATYAECDEATDPTAFPSASVTAGSWAIVDKESFFSIPTAGCMLFGYDEDNDGDVASSEIFGLRLKNNTIEAGVNVSACTLTETIGWTPISDTNDSGVKITAFTINTISERIIDTGVAKAKEREIEISVTGELQKDSSVSRTITESVKLRNDQLI